MPPLLTAEGFICFCVLRHAVVIASWSHDVHGLSVVCLSVCLLVSLCLSLAVLWVPCVGVKCHVPSGSAVAPVCLLSVGGLARRLAGGPLHTQTDRPSEAVARAARLFSHAATLACKTGQIDATACSAAGRRCEPRYGRTLRASTALATVLQPSSG